MYIATENVKQQAEKLKSMKFEGWVIKDEGWKMKDLCCLGETSKKKTTAYFMTSGKLGFWPTYPFQIETK